MLYAALIRHAHYEQPDGVPSAHLLQPLTAAGEAQARALASKLVALIDQCGCELVSELDASPLLRAWQTATLLGDELRVRHGISSEVSQHAALCERSLGAAANLTVDQIRAALARDPRCGALPEDWKSSPNHALPVPGAESLRAAGWRVAEHLRARMQRLASIPRGARLKVFIGHGAAFRHAAYALGVLSLERVAALSMHHCEPVVLRFSGERGFEHAFGEWKSRGVDARPD